MVAPVDRFVRASPGALAGRVALGLLLAWLGFDAGDAFAGPVAVHVVEVEARPAEGAWRPMLVHEVPGAWDRIELRATVELPSRLADRRPMGLLVQLLATCSVRWDGEDLGAGGRPGDGVAVETPGPISQILHVPDRLATPGSHRLDLACTAEHRGFTPTVAFWQLAVGPLDDLVLDGQVGLLPALLSFSGTALIGIFALVVWCLDRRRAPDLWLSLFCFAVAGLSTAESWRRLFGYTYDWHVVRMRLVTVLSWLVVVTLVVYVVRRFPRSMGRDRPGLGRAGRWVVGAVAVAPWTPALLLPPWDAKSTGMFLVGLPLAAVWCGAAVRRHRGAVPAAIGVGACLLVLLWRPDAFIDRMLYPAVGFLLLCLLISHALETRAVRRTADDARLTAARLEIELLRRQLQPHVLMNTLTALAEWVEEDPPTAVRMIGALADEMRALGRASRRSTIPLGDELALCRSHLELLELRHDIRVRLDADGVDLDLPVPPAILHTLVENAVTHGGVGARPTATAGPNEDPLRLTLREQRLGEGDMHDVRRLMFDAPLGAGVDVGATPRPGTGTRYVEARLRQVYGSEAPVGWRFEHGPVGDVWRTIVDLPVEAPAAALDPGIDR